MPDNGSSRPPDEVSGSVTVHSRGFGFLNFEHEGKPQSAFIAPPDLNDFLAGDQVRGRLKVESDGRYSANSLELEQRSRRRLFGEVVSRRGRLWLQVDREVANTDWPLKGDCKPGRYAVARVEGRKAVLDEVLPKDADMALERLIVRYDLQESFPEAVLKQAANITTDRHQLAGRRDLREVPTVTIDSEATRDIDDAISVLPADSDGALRLLVSIADPCEFIPPGSPLDREARGRGTSVYLPGRVLPMLPHELSSDRLSLLPGEERCCLTAELRIDPEGQVQAVDIYESLIRSWAKLTYEEVADWLDYDDINDKLEPLEDEMLPWLRTAAARLSVARQRRGGVRMSGAEARVTLDAEGEVTGTKPTRSSSAHLMIERFMVAANEAVAEWLASRGLPGMFRVHDEPEPERLQALSACAHYFGYEPGFGRRLTPGALAAFDAQIEGSVVEMAVRSVMRGVLGRARYTVHPGLHLGLASSKYLHFTSPLRRYSDMVVHRLIKRYLHGERDFEPADPEVEELALHLNEQSGKAARAESERRRMLLATYMEEHIGEEFRARITRVLPFGLVAQLDASLVEGLIPLEALPGGPWQPDEVTLRGPDREFTLGMAVTVKVVATDPPQGRVEYALVE